MQWQWCALWRNQSLLGGVVACLKGVEQLNAAHLKFLETKNCESDSGVANLGCLLHHRILKNCRWVQAREVDCGEVN